MRTAAIRWTFILAVLFGAGPLVSSLLLVGLRDADGGQVVSLLVNTSPLSGVLRGALMLAAAAGVGLLGAVLFNRDTGLLVTGLMFVWASWRMGTTEEIIRVAGSGSPLVFLAVEGVGIALAGCAIAIAIQKFGRKDHPEGTLLAVHEDSTKLGPAIASMVVAGAIAGGLAGWFVAAVPLKGQSVFAAICAGIAVGAAAQVVGTLHAARPSIVAACLAVVVLAGGGPLLAQFIGGGRVLGDTHAGKLFALARPISFDWLAGAFLGIPIGLSWAASMLDRQPQAVTR